MAQEPIPVTGIRLVRIGDYVIVDLKTAGKTEEIGEIMPLVTECCDGERCRCDRPAEHKAEDGNLSANLSPAERAKRAAAEASDDALARLLIEHARAIEQDTGRAYAPAVMREAARRLAKQKR